MHNTAPKMAGSADLISGLWSNDRAHPTWRSTSKDAVTPTTTVRMGHQVVSEVFVPVAAACMLMLGIRFIIGTWTTLCRLRAAGWPTGEGQELASRAAGAGCQTLGLRRDNQVLENRIRELEKSADAKERGSRIAAFEEDARRRKERQATQRHAREKCRLRDDNARLEADKASLNQQVNRLREEIRNGHKGKHAREKRRLRDDVARLKADKTCLIQKVARLGEEIREGCKGKDLEIARLKKQVFDTERDFEETRLHICDAMRAEEGRNRNKIQGLETKLHNALEGQRQYRMWCVMQADEREKVGQALESEREAWKRYLAREREDRSQVERAWEREKKKRVEVEMILDSRRTFAQKLFDTSFHKDREISALKKSEEGLTAQVEALQIALDETVAKNREISALKESEEGLTAQVEALQIALHETVAKNRELEGVKESEAGLTAQVEDLQIALDETAAKNRELERDLATLEEGCAKCPQREKDARRQSGLREMRLRAKEAQLERKAAALDEMVERLNGYEFATAEDEPSNLADSPASDALTTTTTTTTVGESVGCDGPGRSRTAERPASPDVAWEVVDDCWGHEPETGETEVARSDDAGQSRTPTDLDCPDEARADPGVPRENDASPPAEANDLEIIDPPDGDDWDIKQEWDDGDDEWATDLEMPGADSAGSCGPRE